MRTLFTLLITLFCYGGINAQTTITAKEAKNYVGKMVTVCDSVTDTYQSKKGDSFINFGGTYPNNTFIVVIFDSSLKDFSYAPVTYLKNKNVCITGLIKLYKDMPEIIVKRQDEIEIKGD